MTKFANQVQILVKQTIYNFRRQYEALDDTTQSLSIPIPPLMVCMASISLAHGSSLQRDLISITSIIHLDAVVRAALLPVFGQDFVSRTLTLSDTLDEFSSFYVNKYADYHSFEIAF